MTYRYDLTEYKWWMIAPLLPNKLREVARMDDWRGLNDIYWMLHSSSIRRGLPETYGT